MLCLVQECVDVVELNFPFQQVVQNALFQGGADIVVIVIRAENRDLRRSAHFLNLADQVHAVDQGHLDIRDDQVNCLLVQEVQGLLAIFGLKKFRMALLTLLDQQTEPLSDQEVVVDNQDSLNHALLLLREYREGAA